MQAWSGVSTLRLPMANTDAKYLVGSSACATRNPSDFRISAS
jgi:hypothetical protein